MRNLFKTTSMEYSLCKFWAEKLGKNKADAKKLALMAAELVGQFNEVNPIVAGIVTKRLSKVDTKQVWTYLKPDFQMPDTEHISEAAASMHCLSPDELDILLLREGLGYEMDTVDKILGIRHGELAYIKAFHHLHSLIAFEDFTTPEQQRQIANNVILDMCKEIAENVPKLKAAEPKPKMAMEVKRNIIKSVCIFAAVDIVAVVSIMCIIAFTNGTTPIGNQNAPGTALAYTVDNIRQGIYYAPVYLPKGYYKYTHSISPTVARTVYTNEIGEQLVFTQQVSEKPITGYNDVPEYEEQTIGGRKVALTSEGNRVSAYWYNDFYAYSLTGLVSDTEIAKIVEGVQLQTAELPFKYNRSIALENGDIIKGEATSAMVKRLHNFYENYKQQKNDFIRICEFDGENVTVTEVKLTNGKAYYTNDARRSDYGESTFENGMQFDEMILSDVRGNKQELTLRSGNQQITLITF